LDLLISALAAAFLGSTLSKTGELSIVGAGLAGMFISALSNVLIINGVSNNVLPGILGAVLVLSIIPTVIRKREIGQVTIF
jgi:ribose/xylose/arabinose/galactoside ABC-type transport system permease subunit